MRPMSNSELQAIYPDLLPDPDDRDTVRLVCDLDAALTAQDLPQKLRSFTTLSVMASEPAHPDRPLAPLPGWPTPAPLTQRTRPGSPQSWHRRVSRRPARSATSTPASSSRRWSWRRGFALPAALALLAVLVGVAVAVTNLTNLGRPTNATFEYLPIGSYRHVGPPLYQHGKTEILFVGTQWDSASAAERWPLVKALDQFGTWSGLAPSMSHVTVPRGAPPAADVPTYDWTRSRLRSPYVAFAHEDIVDRSGHRLEKLTPRETALFRRYDPGQQLPLVLVGGYALEGADVPYGDLEDNLGRALLFSAVQKALQRDDSRSYRQLVDDINAEANIITALVCHADGKRPASVCSRPAVKHLLKHVQ